jgi:hypothetical protein
MKKTWDVEYGHFSALCHFLTYGNQNLHLGKNYRARETKNKAQDQIRQEVL